MDPEREPKEGVPHAGVGTVEIALTAFIIILLIGFGAYSLLQKQPGISYPAPTAAEIEKHIRTFTQTFDLLDYIGDGATICVVVPSTEGNEASFLLEHTQGKYRIAPSAEWGCTGEEDFAIRYTNGKEFVDHMNNPTCEKLMGGGKGNPYWWLPSKLWSVDGEPECTVEFKQLYCPALAYCIDPTMFFECCKRDRLSPFQIERLEEARIAGGR